MTRRAFTLIELLVVIAIISILAGILFPVFARAKEQAKTTVCISNVSQLSRAFTMYIDDNNGKYPSDGAMYGYEVPTDWVQVGDNMRPGFIIADVEKGTIYPYVRNKDVYRCPSDTTVTELTYMMCRPFDYLKESAVRFPSTSIVLVGESTGDESYHNDGAFWPLWNDRNWREGGSGADLPAKWHNNGGLYAFADGHARRYLQTDTYFPGGVKNGGPYPKYFHWWQPTRAEEGQ
jgi:prepilin-type N-terminal cleavage/methylation domain-containing protein/prepilin-type processing-associated H-X9-DG protein